MKLNIDKKAVGNRIYNIRNGMNLTLQEFGKILNTSKSTVFQWEKGIALPNNERIVTICKIANLTRNELLYGSIDELIENNLDFISNELEKKVGNISVENLKIVYDYFKNSINKNLPLSLNDDIIIQFSTTNFYMALSDELKNQFYNKFEIIKEEIKFDKRKIKNISDNELNLLDRKINLINTSCEEYNFMITNFQTIYNLYEEITKEDVYFHVLDFIKTNFTKEDLRMLENQYCSFLSDDKILFLENFKETIENKINQLKQLEKDE